METVAELRLSHDRLVLDDTIEAHPGLRVQFTAQAPIADGGWMLFLTASGDGATDLDETLRHDSTVADPTRLTTTADNCISRGRIVDGLRVSGVLGDLADDLDISQQAASERLRRAVGSLLEETF